MIEYEALSKTGEKIKGAFSGSKDELIKYLKSENYILISIKEKKDRTGRKKKLKLDDIYSGLEQIYYLISAGLKIDKAINTIIRRIDNSSLSDFWQNVLLELKSGKQFSQALKETAEKEKINIPIFYINTISVGESVGDIKSSLKIVLEDVEFKNNLKKEIKTTLSYPIFLLFMNIFTIFIIAGLILPKFTEIFSPEEINKLPSISYFVIKTGEFIRNNMSFLIIFSISVILLIIYILSDTEKRKFLIKFLYKVPYINNILLKIELSNIFSSLGTMLKGGLHITDAIEFTKSITSHPSLKNILEEVKIEIKKGKKISQVLSNYSIIPYEATVLISVGEESSNLDSVLEKLGKKYVMEFKDSISRLLTLLEPAVIILVGIFIGFIVVAILLAVLSISDVL